MNKLHVKETPSTVLSAKVDNYCTNAMYISHLGTTLQTALDVEVLDDFGVLAADWRLAVDVLSSPLEEEVLNTIRCDILASYETKSQQENSRTLVSINIP